jgi:hypothetical protein
MVGVAPTLGGLMLAGIFVKAFSDYNTTSTEVNYTGGVFGIGTPVAIGVGLLVLGVVVMVFAQFAYPSFFKRKPEVANPGILEGTVVGKASVMADPD